MFILTDFIVLQFSFLAKKYKNYASFLWDVTYLTRQVLGNSCYIHWDSYLLCFGVLCRTFIKCWNFRFSKYFCKCSFSFWLYCKYSIFNIILLWSNFYIRRRWLDIRTHADSSVSPTLLSNVSPTARKTFSLFCSIHFGRSWLASSFFFCLFLIQNTTEWNF